MAIAVERAPRALHWVERVDDLSWWEVDGDDGWCDLEALAPTVNELLHEIGRTYAPFMLANAAALGAGDNEVVCTIDGAEYRQAPFRYQGKCLAWLREAHDALDAADRAIVADLLAGTGCEPLVA
jgi:hypothetical protein